MKTQLAVWVLFLASAYAWKVDRRCTKETEVLVGDEVDTIDESDEDFVPIILDEESFNWGDLTAYDVDVDVEEDEDEEGASILGDFEDDEEESPYLRGSSVSRFRNQSSTLTNATRMLQGGKTFNLKLTWRRGACWQDEWIERKWCMSCRRSCNSGDVLELERCQRNWKQRFQWQNGRLKVASKNVCLTRTGGLRLRPCGGGNQNFRGFKGSGGFQLKPSSSSKCLSQHHHPKAGEIIELVNCGLAAQHSTDKWNVYWPTGSSGGGGGGNNDKDDDRDDNDGNNGGGGSGPALTRRGKACSSSNKCGKCEGDCDSDSDCQGNLQCKQRFGKNSLSPVRGCSGTGRKGTDYCY